MQLINLDISQIPEGKQPVLWAKQGEVGRKFKAVITDNGNAYTVAAGATVSVWYAGTAGEGNYTHVGQNAAAVISGNEITVELIAQMLAVSGGGVLSLALNRSDGSQLGLWNIHYWVEPVPGADSPEAESYYTAFSKAVEQLNTAAAALTFPIPLEKGGTGAGSAAAARTNLDVLSGTEVRNLVNGGKTKAVKLWQTANWQASFEGEQYIDLGEGNTTAAYDCIVVLCYYSTGVGYILASPLIFSTYCGTVYYPKGYCTNEVTRWFRRDGGQAGRMVYVGHGFKDGAQNDSVCIPGQIYGIKW